MRSEEKDSSLDLHEIVRAIKSVLPQNQGRIGLHEPVFAGKEWAYTKECLDTGWVSSVGKFVDKFEKDLAEFTGVKRAVAVANGTSALHICLLLAGVQPNDEVLVPALTFVATANAVAYCGAIPHFVDSEYRSLGMDAVKLNEYLNEYAEIRDEYCYNKTTGRRIKAVVPMHTFGHPVDLEAFVALCDKFKLFLIEDAAESVGSYYKGKHTGNWGILSAVSFNGNKIITTGGGGAILTNDEELGSFAKHVTTQAKLPHQWEFFHDHIGYNYRMPNINAALGCAQLEQLPGFIEQKRQLAKKYKKALADIPGIIFQNEPPFAQSNYWLNAILLEERYADKRDELLVLANDNGIMARPVWNLMYTLPMFKTCPRMKCDTAESIFQRLVNIPSSANL